MTHEEMYTGSPVVVGKKYVFDYPVEFTTLDAYSAHRGQTVTVLRPCTADEADVLWDDLMDGKGDQIVDRQFMVRAPDGWEGAAWESELVTE
jgi:hypothetical protein